MKKKMVEKKVEKKGLKLPSKRVELTKAQKDILHLVSDEFLTIKQIAQRRNCSLQAVYKIINKIKEKGIIWGSNRQKNKKDIRTLILEEDGELHFSNVVDDCYFCGFVDVIHYHHIVQKCKGGKDKKDNILPLCPNCHSLLHSGDYCLYFKDGFYFIVNNEFTFVKKYPYSKENLKNIPISSLPKLIKVKNIREFYYKNGRKTM